MSHQPGFLFGRKCEGYASKPNDLKVTELKEIATSYGLSTSGKKDELCQRIREYLISKEAATDVAEGIVKKAIGISRPKGISQPKVKKTLVKKQVTGKRTLAQKKTLITIEPEVILQTLDDLMEQLNIRNVNDLTSLSPELIDYFISITQLRDQTQELTDIVNQKIRELGLRDPAKINELKIKTLIEELADKFCRCIKKTKKDPITEAQAIGICRKGVINNKGLRIYNFKCEDKKTGAYTPIFLPKSGEKELLYLHPTFQNYDRENREQSTIENLKTWKKMPKAQRNEIYKKGKWN